MKVAIDGPAGAGKSTISKAAAKKLGFIYVDTGAMYRAVALCAIRNGIDTKNNVADVVRLLKKIRIDIDYINSEQHIFLNEEDVSGLIRTPEVSVGASNVAVIPEVRLSLVELQRELAERHDVIMDGRDIGTYVLPNAELKIFLTASDDERAKRRYEELCVKGVETDFESVKKDMMYRDKNDSEREFAPLKPAEDSIILDTTSLNIEQVIEEVINEVKKCSTSC